MKSVEEIERLYSALVELQKNGFGPLVGEIRALLWVMDESVDIDEGEHHVSSISQT